MSTPTAQAVSSSLGFESGDDDSMLGPVDIDSGAPVPAYHSGADYDDDDDDDEFEDHNKGDDDDAAAHNGDGSMVDSNAVPTVGWLRQLWVILWYKNLPLLQRKPVHVMILLLSGVASVLLAWPAGRDYDSNDAIFPPLTDCGTISPTYLATLNDTEVGKVKLSINGKWQDALPVAVLSLGPLLTAITSYLIVHEELQLHMLGILRGLGMPDSVYWVSWYVPFTVISLINSILAGATAKAVPVHVFDATYFAGICGSFFFVQLALVGSSFFLAAVSGTARRGAVWLILVMMIACWIPFLVINTQRPVGLTAETVSMGGEGVYTPVGLFWINRQTLVLEADSSGGTSATAAPATAAPSNATSGNGTLCNFPILSQQEGNFYKTEAQRSEVPPDQFFLGCYASAGFGATAWAPKKKTKFGLAVFWFFPYFHFTNIWGNFCGLTGNPNTEFNAHHASMTAGELARAGLPVAPSEANSFGTTLFPQGSMLQEAATNRFECETLAPDNTCILQKSNCPAQNLNGGQYDFCPSLAVDNNCKVAPEPSPANGKSVLSMYGMLLALSMIYMLMAAYWGIVFIGGAGTHPYYFLFMRSYWFGAKRRRNQRGPESDAEVAAGPRGAGAVKVQCVSKSYGGVQALKPVSFEMARGEVTALLGHNGAGKTTLSKVLTCEVAATTGDITVFGHSVRDDPNAVRRLVGVCKQDDYLWPNLTAKEHLDLFGGLRGVDPEEHDEIVQKWLESVDLETVQHQNSAEFSGGMKRRLSLALSTIGSRMLIVLDEPTTGMDPVSRRFVWKHIDEIKKDRVVLLTTHAMEEADLLADMVAIMRKGELAAWGSPLQLKSEHGSALQFSVMVDKEKVSTTAAKIRAHFASTMNWVKIDPGEAGNITVNIQKIQQSDRDQGVGVDVLTSFVGWLEDSDNSGVSEYGFSNSSLEEVFLKVTEGDVDETQNAISTDQGTETPEVDELTSADVSGRNLTEFKPNLTVRGQVEALVWQNFVKTWTGTRSLGSWLMYGLFVTTSTIVAIWLAGTADKIPPLAIQVTLISFILLSVCSGIYGDRAEGLFYLMRTQGLLKTSFLLGNGLYAFAVSFLYSFVLLAVFYATPYFRDPSQCTPNYQQNKYCDSIKFGQSPIINVESIQEVSDLFNGTDVNGTSVRIFAYPTPGGYSLVFGAGVVFALTVPGAALASSYLPGHKFALVVIAFIALACGITPVITYFLSVFIKTPGDLQNCINEIVPGSVCDQQYTINTANADFLNCVGLVINQRASLCVPAYAALLPQFGLFQELSMALTANINFYSEPAEYAEQVLIPSIKGGDCSGDSCAFPFAKELYLKNVGWEIFGAVILIIVGVAVAHIFAFPTAWVLHVKSMLAHGVEHVRCRRGKSKQAHQATDDKEELEEVVQERETVQKIIQPLLLTKPAADDFVADVDGSDGDSDSDATPVIADHSTIPRNDLPPILMYKLRKVYPSFGRVPPKVALKSLDLQVPRGQVLGFLGKNGAGKTTALKILAGAHDATSGIGLVSGYDVSCERINVFERLGNCPQFDVIWPTMTVKEHLVFFAKIKGLPRKKLRDASQSIAKAVGLGSNAVYNRNAGALSGGMRRRLSIAIALVGAPSVFVLDEPTTGLDPSTRNNIWGLVNSFATDERAIVITTHMMLEADTLCNRIAIISKGELVVVATQQRLKDKFGSGYLLQLNLVKSTPANQEMAMIFAREQLHKDATLGTKQAKTLHLNLPRDLDLKKAFAALYNPTIRPACINQFLLSQSSLEDVFIALGD